jgi:hypothetical protein
MPSFVAFAPGIFARVRFAPVRSMRCRSCVASRRPMTVSAAWASGRVTRSDTAAPLGAGSGHCSRECIRMKAARTSMTVRWPLGESRATRSRA